MLWIRNWGQYQDQWGILVMRFLKYLSTVCKGTEGQRGNVCRVYKETLQTKSAFQQGSQCYLRVAKLNAKSTNPFPDWDVFAAALVLRCCRTRLEAESGLQRRNKGDGRGRGGRLKKTLFSVELRPKGHQMCLFVRTSQNAPQGYPHERIYCKFIFISLAFSFSISCSIWL